MEILDTTIVNVALPHIAGSLSSSSDEATWTLTSYLVANGIVLTISGWLGNVLGRKRYFLICIAMFTVCSFLCGTSSSLGELIVFRLLQGFFGGGLQPNQQSIILDYFPPEKRGAAFGVTAVAIIVAPILGPTLGGFITDSSSWRWIFYINVPVGIVAVFLVSLLVDDPPWARARPRGTDFIGLGFIAVGLGCLQVMLDRGEDADWFGSGFIMAMAMIAAAGLVGAVLWLIGREEADRPSRSLQGQEFCRRLRHDQRHGRNPLCERGRHSAIRAAGDRLYGDLGRAHSVARRRRRFVPYSLRRAAHDDGPDALYHRDGLFSSWAARSYFRACWRPT